MRERAASLAEGGDQSTSDAATMETVPERARSRGRGPAHSSLTPEEPMDYGWMSHALLWIIGLMSVGSAVAVVGALFTLGRSGYRKD